jgi:hypothetical protein
MKDLGVLIYSLLFNDLAIKAETKGKIFPNIEQQSIEKGTYIVYEIEDVNTNKCQSGTVYHATYCLHVCSLKYDKLDNLCYLIRNKLDRLTGIFSNIEVSAIIYQEEGDDYIFEEKIHSRTQKYKVTIFKQF